MSLWLLLYERNSRDLRAFHSLPDIGRHELEAVWESKAGFMVDELRTLTPEGQEFLEADLPRAYDGRPRFLADAA